MFTLNDKIIYAAPVFFLLNNDCVQYKCFTNFWSRVYVESK